MFKINAPSAQSVQVDLGKKYEMTRDEKGDWTCTTEPQGPGAFVRVVSAIDFVVAIICHDGHGANYAR